MRFTILLSLLALLLAACDRRRPVDDTLDRAEALMMSAPDSALSLLETVDPAELRGDRRTALHALLLSQAMDKNYIDTDNDSLINIAVNFYATDDDHRHRMLANYYLGRVKYNAKDYPATMLAYFKAFDMAKEQNDHYWAGLSAREISKTYSETANSDEEIYYAKIAYEQMRLTGLHSHICSSLNRLTQALFDNGANSECLRYSFEMLDSVKIHGVQKFEYNAVRMIGKVYLVTDRYDEAIPCFEKVCGLEKATYNDSCYLGLSCLFAGRDSDALKIFNSINPNGSLQDAWLRQQLALRRNDYKAAHEALVAIDSCLVEKYKRLMHSGFSRLLIEHINTEKNLAQKNYDKAQTAKWLYIAGGALLIGLVVYIALRHSLKQRRVLRQNVAIAEELHEILSIKDKQNSKVKATLNDMVKSHYETIDSLCRMCYESKESRAIQMRISDEVSSLIDSLTVGSERLSKLEKQADEQNNNVISRFKAAFPDLKDADYKLFLFLTLGFSIPAITLLLREDKIEAVYNRKARLKTKIKKFGGTDAGDFLKTIS